MYDPLLTYEANYANGPSAASHSQGRFPKISYLGNPGFLFFGVPLYLPFGMPAGPLLNSKYIRVASSAGMCVNIYKTVRSAFHPCHPLPNILSAASDFKAKSHMAVLAKTISKKPVIAENISNSFGVPSAESALWQQDFRSLPTEAGKLSILSFQGTRKSNFDSLVQDFVLCQNLAVKAFSRNQDSAHVLEVNLSCPNEGGNPLYTDLQSTLSVLKVLKSNRPDSIKLIVKIGSMGSIQTDEFVDASKGLIDGISAINTVPVRFLNEDGKTPALGIGREVGGLCGGAIFDAGLLQVNLLTAARKKWNIPALDFPIVAVGGVMGVREFKAYRDAGADIVLAATGAMWNLEIVQSIAQYLGVSFEVLSERHHSSVL